MTHHTLYRPVIDTFSYILFVNAVVCPSDIKSSVLMVCGTHTHLALIGRDEHAHDTALGLLRIEDRL